MATQPASFTVTPSGDRALSRRLEWAGWLHLDQHDDHDRQRADEQRRCLRGDGAGRARLRDQLPGPVGRDAIDS